MRKPPAVRAVGDAQAEVSNAPGIRDVDPAIWAQAREQAEAVRTLIEQGAISEKIATHLARQWQVSRATVWRHQENRHQDALLLTS